MYGVHVPFSVLHSRFQTSEGKNKDNAILPVLSGRLGAKRGLQSVVDTALLTHATSAFSSQLTEFD